MRCWVLLHKRFQFSDVEALPGGILLPGEHALFHLLPLSRGYLLGSDGQHVELPVLNLPDRHLLFGGLHFPDELLAGDLPAV